MTCFKGTSVSDTDKTILDTVVMTSTRIMFIKNSLLFTTEQRLGLEEQRSYFPTYSSHKRFTPGSSRRGRDGPLNSLYVQESGKGLDDETSETIPWVTRHQIVGTSTDLYGTSHSRSVRETPEKRRNTN